MNNKTFNSTMALLKYEAMSLNELQALLNKHNNLFYTGTENGENISDEEFDILFEVTRSKEESIPESERLTNRVNAPSTDSGDTLVHMTPMISIKTVTDTSFNGFSTFDNYVRGLLDIPVNYPIEYGSEYKYDGLGLSLRYENGVLKDIITRGDGVIGTRCTVAKSRFKDSYLPKEISPLFSGEIRGEAMMSRTTFIWMNSELTAAGKEPKINPRNAVAGAVRSKEPDSILEGHLLFIPYDIGASTLQFRTQEEKLIWLRKEGFTIPDIFEPKVFTYPPREIKGETPYDFYLKADKERSNCGLEYDGIVHKVNDISLQQRLGSRMREPRWCIAQKFKSEVVRTRMTGVTFQVGRTGVVTPVATVEPAYICGVTVTSVNLDNFFNIRRLNIRLGDEVFLVRGGDTIPKIQGLVKRGDGVQPNIRAPKTCPCCGGSVTREKGYRDYLCTNTTCPERVRQGLIFFASREYMGMKGASGPVLISELYANGHLLTPLDFFKLNKQQVQSVIGDRLAEKAIEAIRKSRSCKDWTLLSALGIPSFGRTYSKEFCSRFPLKDIKDFTLTDLRSSLRNDDGTSWADVRAEASLINYLSYPPTAKLLADLLEELKDDIEFTYAPKNSKETLNGTVALTGGFEGGKRTIKDLLEANNWKSTSSVSKSSCALIVGTAPTDHKVAKANALGIPVYTWEEFKQKL